MDGRIIGRRSDSHIGVRNGFDLARLVQPLFSREISRLACIRLRNIHREWIDNIRKLDIRLP